MATSTPEELDRQLDEFIDKLVEDKDHLPTKQLDEAFWKIRKYEKSLFIKDYFILYVY